jgi:hypothetical protein
LVTHASLPAPRRSHHPLARSQLEKSPSGLGRCIQA